MFSGFTRHHSMRVLAVSIDFLVVSRNFIASGPQFWGRCPSDATLVALKCHHETGLCIRSNQECSWRIGEIQVASGAGNSSKLRMQRVNTRTAKQQECMRCTPLV